MSQQIPTHSEVPLKPNSGSPTGSLSRSLEAARLAWRRAGAGLFNARRRLVLKRLPDYVTLTLDRPISELSPPQPWWMRLLPMGSPPLTLQALSPILRRVADDPNIAGIVLFVRNPAMSRTTAQNLAALLERFRRRDRENHPDAPTKRIVVWSEQIGAASALAFSAADYLLLAPQGGWEVPGVRVERIYLREALDRAGIQTEVVKVAPWKTAVDALIEPRMSDAERDQYGWLLDSLFSQLVTSIAQGRSLPPERVHALIDETPLSADEALAAGLVDALLYEDEVAAWLGKAHPSAPTDDAPAKSARLRRYSEVDALLYRRVRPRARRSIGLLDLRGAIVTGESRSFPIPIPLLGGEMMGSNSVQQSVRAARKDRDLAAVVVRIDSGGGSAAASDLMWRELRLLAQEKPLVIYMGDVAASGGYYIATPGASIIAQAGTLTGSIGVIVAKVTTEEALARYGAHRDSVERGANSGLFSDAQTWSESQRGRMQSLVDQTYRAFRQRVEEGRGLAQDALESLAGGRVWTGAQALEHGLIDKVGDLQSAFEEAARLAGIPPEYDLRVHTVKAGHRLPAAPVASGVSTTALVLLRALGATGGTPQQATQLAALAAAQVTAQQSAWQELLRRETIWLLVDNLPID